MLFHTVVRIKYSINRNPGTGKTLLAKLIAEFLHAYGILKSNSVIECVLRYKKKYVGEAARNIVELFQRGKGGVVCIDEISLAVLMRTKIPWLLLLIMLVCRMISFSDFDFAPSYLIV
jgi:replication-associated recombination protein RarA